jgi:hypothetical protein
MERKIYFPAAAPKVTAERRGSPAARCSLILGFLQLLAHKKRRFQSATSVGGFRSPCFPFRLSESARVALFFFYNQPDSLAATTTIDLFFG